MNKLPDHFHLAPSSSYRWINCPGCLEACKDIPDEAGEAAQRGTLGHRLVEIALNRQEVGEQELNQLTDMPNLMRAELYDHVRLCIDLVNELPTPCKAYENKIQHELIEEHGGTVDVIACYPEKAILHVIDFKFGRIKVDIEDNTQIKCYLNLARQEFPWAKHFYGSIIQPIFSDQLQTVEFSREELDEHEKKVLKASISNYLEAGDHCQWCPKAPTCQVLAEYSREQIKDFPDLTALVGGVKETPTDEEIENLCKIYKTFKLVEKATEGAGDILKRWAREGADVKQHGLGVRTTRRAYWAEFAEDVLLNMGLDPATYLRPHTLQTPKALRETLGLSKKQFEETYSEALDHKDVHSLVMGRNSNEFPEFD